MNQYNRGREREKKGRERERKVRWANKHVIQCWDYKHYFNSKKAKAPSK